MQTLKKKNHLISREGVWSFFSASLMRPRGEGMENSLPLLQKYIFIGMRTTIV